MNSHDIDVRTVKSIENPNCILDPIISVGVFLGHFGHFFGVMILSREKYFKIYNTRWSKQSTIFKPIKQQIMFRKFKIQFYYEKYRLIKINDFYDKLI